MPRKDSVQITFNVTDKATREKLNTWSHIQGYKSIGELARHLVQEASGIDCIPKHGGDRSKKES